MYSCKNPINKFGPVITYIIAAKNLLSPASLLYSVFDKREKMHLVMLTRGNNDKARS